MKLFVALKKSFRKIAISLNFMAALSLIFSYLSTIISPVHFYGFAFLGLIYGWLLLINLLFIIFWLFQKSKLSLISFFTIILGWNLLTSFFQISFNNSQPDINQQEIKILTYNVRVFNRWKWSTEKNSGAKTIDFIKKSKSNIVCLQEFYSGNIDGNNTLDSIKKETDLHYFHISNTKKNNKTYRHGLATFTNYPIVERGRIGESFNENFCIYTDVQIGQDTLRVYNIHLESIHLGYEDYHLIENIDNTDTLNVKGIRSILSKLKKSYIKRANQAEEVALHISSCKYPLVLCGDFNDTPVSYVYKSLSLNLTDAFCINGNGIGSTYINKLSTFRIDYILYSSNIQSFNYSRSKIYLSDHFPVQCTIQLKK